MPDPALLSSLLMMLIADRTFCCRSRPCSTELFKVALTRITDSIPPIMIRSTTAAINSSTSECPDWFCQADLGLTARTCVDRTEFHLRAMRRRYPDNYHCQAATARESLACPKSYIPGRKLG